MVLMISPTLLKLQGMVSSTVLNTPHGTYDISHVDYDIPTVLKITPHGTQDIPHGAHDIPPWY